MDSRTVPIAVWSAGVGTPEAVWVISGDLPTDYLPYGNAATPREAVGAFASRWARVSENMLASRADPEIAVGKPKDWPQLGDLLKRRASLLKEFAEQDEIWEE